MLREGLTDFPETVFYVKRQGEGLLGAGYDNEQTRQSHFLESSQIVAVEALSVMPIDIPGLTGGCTFHSKDQRRQVEQSYDGVAFLVSMLSENVIAVFKKLLCPSIQIDADQFLRYCRWFGLA